MVQFKRAGGPNPLVKTFTTIKRNLLSYMGMGWNWMLYIVYNYGLAFSLGYGK